MIVNTAFSFKRFFSVICLSLDHYLILNTDVKSTERLLLASLGQSCGSSVEALCAFTLTRKQTPKLLEKFTVFAPSIKLQREQKKSPTKTGWYFQGETSQNGFLMAGQLWWNPALFFILLIDIVNVFDCKPELFGYCFLFKLNLVWCFNEQ